MAYHKQKFGGEHVPEPHGAVAVSLVRLVEMSADGSEVVSRRPVYIALAAARGGGSSINLTPDKARSIGQALIAAADTFDKEAQ